MVRLKRINTHDGNSDLNEIDIMLMLKNRLGKWKKEVQIFGYTLLFCYLIMR